MRSLPGTLFLTLVLVFASSVSWSATAPPKKQTTETATQFYLRWRTTALNAKSMGEITPFWTSETIEVTDRGRPVAVLAPPPEGSALDRLRALGELEPATGDLDDLPEPLVLAPGTEHPSKALGRLRRNER